MTARPLPNPERPIKVVDNAHTGPPNTVPLGWSLKQWSIIVGIVISVGTVCAAGAGQYTSYIRDQAAAEQREQMASDQRTELDVRDQAQQGQIDTIYKVLRLERVNDVRTEQMLEMILEHQGQVPPKKPQDVQDAETEIDQLLSSP